MQKKIRLSRFCAEAKVNCHLAISLKSGTCYPFTTNYTHAIFAPPEMFPKF